MHLSRQYQCRSLRCSWSIACRRCSNYIFILDLTSGFKRFGKDSCKTVWESFKCWDLVPLILETWQYIKLLAYHRHSFQILTTDTSQFVSTSKADIWRYFCEFKDQGEVMCHPESELWRYLSAATRTVVQCLSNLHHVITYHCGHRVTELPITRMNPDMNWPDSNWHRQHEEVMTSWKCFLHYWPIVRGIHRWLVDSSHNKTIM